jgi:hypothetical protein
VLNRTECKCTCFTTIVRPSLTHWFWLWIAPFTWSKNRVYRSTRGCLLLLDTSGISRGSCWSIVGSPRSVVLLLPPVGQNAYIFARRCGFVIGLVALQYLIAPDQPIKKPHTFTVLYHWHTWNTKRIFWLRVSWSGEYINCTHMMHLSGISALKGATVLLQCCFRG